MQTLIIFDGGGVQSAPCHISPMVSRTDAGEHIIEIVTKPNLPSAKLVLDNAGLLDLLQLCARNLHILPVPKK